ncbi:MAG: hypothetical protein QOH60_5097 [Mycobacterium sp.]|jgi:hypothetical protein|nr:hypothetical protein [Mycobacterium sp.]
MELGEEPFVGSEAILRGLVRKHELRARYRSVYPDVYVTKELVLTLHQRAHAAWLWSHRHGIIAGLTAAALHGSKWVDDSRPIELIWPNSRRPRGLRTYDFRLRAHEYAHIGDFLVTTLERTAFDIGRHGSLNEAVARLDALGNATGFHLDEVRRIARDHPGARGVRQLLTGLDLYDPGAASPKERWLRLLIIRAGYPRPQTQIPVRSPDGSQWYYLDMGWENLKLAVEYDGDQHRVDPVRFAYDIRRLEDLQTLGWTDIRVTARHPSSDVMRRVQRAWDQRARRDC